VADKLVIRVEITQIVEHDERVEKSDSCKEQQLRGARDHFLSPRVGTEAGSSGFMLTWSPRTIQQQTSRKPAQQLLLSSCAVSVSAKSPKRSLTRSIRIIGNGRLDQFGPKLGLLTGFGGGEWFALDLVHQRIKPEIKAFRDDSSNHQAQME
jgi:hypothetical protein